MFRERMNVSVSKAEDEIVLELQRMGLCNYMRTQIGHKFNPYHDKVEGTRTDIEYSDPYNLCIFIDCIQIHDKPKQYRRDTLITAALIKRNYTVKRYRYDYPLRVYRRHEITQDIKATLLAKGYTPTK